jgi:hypothetical protein
MEINDIVQYGLISKLINGDNIYISIISIFFIWVYNWCILHIGSQERDIIKLRFLNNNFFNNYYTVTISGDKTITHTDWRSKQSDSYSDTFKAFLDYIDNNNFKNIHYIEEDSNINDSHNDEKVGDNKSGFTINQKFFIYLEDDIYIKMTRRNNEVDEPKKERGQCSYIQSYSIDLIFLSFKKDTDCIKKYLNNITDNYHKKIIHERSNKKFTYMLKNAGPITNDDELSMCWNEYNFNTNKSFDTLFIENKRNILKQIDFFNNNEEWYKNKGNPYTLGIGLYGPPGTGKTSFIKSLAKYLNRHLIIIPLSKIYTEEQLNNAFYELNYVSKNKENIDFNQKIICFEDIDCMSDIVNKRNKKITKDNGYSSDSSCNSESNSSINKTKKKSDKYFTVDMKPVRTITLSCILNLIDGIIEHPGRIIIMTSNHYEKLDPALVRPGRIDIEIEMKNASAETINEYYKYNYKTDIPKNALKKIKDYAISPCQLINIYTSVNNKKEFIDKVISLQN